MSPSRFLPALLLTALAVAGESQEERKATSVLALRAEEPELRGEGDDPGLLIREILRQGVLIAGREGLGLATRDEALREPLGEGQVLGLRSRSLRDGSVQVALTRGEGAARKTLWEKTLKLPAGGPYALRPLAELVEPLSRGELVEALRQAGYAGKARVPAADLAIPEDADRRFKELNVVDQVAALRVLHEACWTGGESPARLGAFVRLYANLGQLTRGLWNASDKVFAARSLLYAERLRAAAPGTRTALWHRAYALTLTGLHKEALDDLVKAAALPEGKEIVPTWVAWIEACCSYDTPKLAGNDPLEKFLAYLTVENCGSHSFERRKVVEALGANPDCYRLVDAMCAISGVSNLHKATVIGPQMLGSRIYARLKALPNLPKRVKDAIEGLKASPSEFEVRASTWKALLASPEPVEPSWSLVGRLIEETTFAQTVRRGEFMRYSWNVPTEEFVSESAPLIADHPYRAVVSSYGLDRNRQKKEWAALFDRVSCVDVSDPYLPLVRATWDLDPGGRILGKKAWDLATHHRDATAFDLGATLRFFRKEEVDQRRKTAHELLAVSPYSPAAIAELSASDWAAIEPRAGELEKSLGHQPPVLRALGKRYLELKRLDDAERCLKAEVELASDFSATRLLAQVYLERGDEKKWQATLEASLKFEDVGLAHEEVRVELARHFMKLGKWDEAEPFAARAAESWASWAMACARDCYEGKRDWEKAELWQQRISERYDGEQIEWFFWCKRNQKGNLRGAAALAEQYFKELAPRATAVDDQKRGVFYALTGRPKEALAAFTKGFSREGDPYCGIHVALLALELKDVPARDAALQQVVEKGPAFRSKGEARTSEVLLGRAFQDLLAQGEGTRPEPGTFTKILDGASNAGTRANVTYFIGRFSELRYSAAEAKPYYEQCVGTGQTKRWTYLMCKEAQGR
jgi:tetratricopeptide (TPR) repeat protein